MSGPFPGQRRSVSARGLSVRRGGRLLFAELDFVVEPGEALLLRGPNGAGKSSLLLTLCGALRPETGRVEVTGGDDDAPPQTQMHLVAHATALKGQLTLAENLGFWAELYGARNNGVGAALTQIGLGGLDDLPAGYLSAGQGRRLALARLLVAPRPIWLLDEPTTALDAEGEGLVLRMLDTHLEEGGIVIAATHQDLVLTGATRTQVIGAP